MKKILGAFFAVCALSALALDNTIKWNGFWDTTGYVNPTVSEATSEPPVTLNLWFFDTAASDSPESFETFQIGYLLFLR